MHADNAHLPPPLRLIACLAAVSIGVCAALAQSGPPGGNPLPTLAEFYLDQRDYQGNLTTTDSSTAPASHPDIEWNRVPGQIANVSHVAYVKGGTATIAIRLFNYRNHTITGSLNVTDARLECPGPSSTNPGPEYLGLSVSCSSPSFSILSNDDAVVTVTLQGLPSYAAVGALQVKYNLPLDDNPNGPGGDCDNGTRGNWVTWERICILNAAPVGYLEDDEMAVGESPWEHGIWTDFLEYTCRWAFGATTSDDACVRMTEGIHQSKYAYRNWLYFEASNSRYWIPSPDPAQLSIFELGEFLNALSDPNVQQQRCVPLDCRDFSGLLQLALGTQGIYSGCVAYKAQPGTKFMTWPLCPAGSDPTLTGPAYPYTPTVSGNYMSTWFSAHMVVHIGESAFDASNAYFFDYSGFPWAKTPYFWNRESLWQWGPNFFGLAYRPTTGTEQDMANNTYQFFNTQTSIQIPFQYSLGYKPTFIKDFLS